MTAVGARTLQRSMSAVALMSSMLLPLAVRAAPSHAVASLNPLGKPPTTPKPTAPKCPGGMSAIATSAGGYCIDKYENTLVDVGAGGMSTPHSPYEIVGKNRVKAVTKKGVVPQGYISQVEAAAACEEADKRLCTPDEWMLACQGKKPTTYPYGDDEVPGRCNGDGTRLHPIVELFGATGAGFADPTKMNDPRINALPDTLSKTGARKKCRSSYDVYDMVGNLHEWTANPSGEFKGGYYMDTHKNGDGCFYKTTAHATSYHDYSTGFRCCK